ncbi:MAG: metallophosphoesterase family protein [Anaerolineae bacterium]|nr:metallophosphoesterase family protein [Anaerolineae bacterium]
MTRLAILSDIHGNLPALEAVLADMAQYQVDHVVVAGDVINVGPHSAAVAARVTASGWAVIRGNNEYYLLDYGTDRAPDQWQHYTLIPWLHRQMGGYWQTIIAGWPDTLCLRYPDAPPVRVAHGTPRSPWESIFPTAPEDEIAAMLDGVEETTLIVGHTHLPFEREVGSWHIINPGSVGIPLDGMPGASYAVLDGSPAGWAVTFRRVDFDYATLFEDLERSHIDDLPGVIGELVRREFQTARLHLYPFNRWRETHHPGIPQSADLLAQFTEEARWAYTPAPYHLHLEPA